MERRKWRHDSFGSMGLGENIKLFRKRIGMSQERLAKKVGVSQPTITQLESGESQTTKHIFKIAKALKVSPRQLDPNIPAASETQVPIKGYVGAGAEAHYYAEADDPGDEVPMPPGGTKDTVAVIIRGTSLGSMFDRWVVFYDEVRTPPTPDMYRKLCVVGLADGRVLVKKIIPSGKKGLFHLESQTEGVIEDQALEWCAVVKAMTPR